MLTKIKKILVSQLGASEIYDLTFIVLEILENMPKFFRNLKLYFFTIRVLWAKYTPRNLSFRYVV